MNSGHRAIDEEPFHHFRLLNDEVCRYVPVVGFELRATEVDE